MIFFLFFRQKNGLFLSKIIELKNISFTFILNWTCLLLNIFRGWKNSSLTPDKFKYCVYILHAVTRMDAYRHVHDGHCHQNSTFSRHSQARQKCCQGMQMEYRNIDKQVHLQAQCKRPGNNPDRYIISLKGKAAT